MLNNEQLPTVSVVILNYNTADLLKRLLPFVLKTNYANLEVVVADNNSSDHSVKLVKASFPTVKIIRLHTNLGFAGGYNEALGQLKTDYWVLLNSDVEVTANWLKPMMDLMLSNIDIAAIQPKILDYSNRDKFEYAGASGGFIDYLGYPFCRGRVFDSVETDIGQYNDSKAIFWASGAAMLVRAKDYLAVGGMDDEFFAHMEEIDMCWRFHNFNKEVWVCPESVVYHMGGGTLSALSPRKTYLNFRNNLALLTKNLPARQVPLKILSRLLLDGIAGVRFVLDFKFDHCFAIVKAHFTFYIKMGAWWGKRKQISQHREPSTLSGWYSKSIVWAFFVRKIKTFSGL